VAAGGEKKEIRKKTGGKEKGGLSSERPALV
jgi:hypothetical protein